MRFCSFHTVITRGCSQCLCYQLAEQERRLLDATVKLAEVKTICLNSLATRFGYDDHDPMNEILQVIERG